MKVFYQPLGYGWQEMVEACRDDNQFTPEYVLSKFDGYVSPNGDFYGTRPTSYADYNEVNDCHEEFAYRFITNNDYKLTYHTFKDTLVNALGWVSCSFSVLRGWQWMKVVDVVQPNLTKEQIKTLKLIFELRGIKPNEILRGGIDGFLFE